MDIKWLKTFITAAKYENLRRASEDLFLTQPALSKHIKKLESHLNTKLFDRVGKNITLTPAGYQFLSYAKEMVEKYDKGMEEFEAWEQGYNRKLTIAVAPQIASSILPGILRGFIDKYPDIEIIVDIVNSFKIGEQLCLGKAEIGISRMEPVQKNLSCEVIHEDPVILVAPYRKNENFPVEEEVLKQYRVLTNNHPTYWSNLLTEIKRSYPRIRTMPVTQIEISKRFIEKGLGVSYLPLSMVREELQQQTMIEIKHDKVLPTTSFTYVVTKIETPEVQLFTSFLTKEFEKMLMT
ncbi:LysR family transcriptional regulator [Bacillus norwichensis]|uniref:LysR family transcriptional regulator n=1 Tax=Bacillus norwichensis TaxID=2762217 RepID=A0ABR8VGJ8_9BACI|nr:LysR family transcriptional regulator [Bacillus norwichensis]MBD8003894.1 LysR family transcriptional regulator [Bacillus norwichensis]